MIKELFYKIFERQLLVVFCLHISFNYFLTSCPLTDFTKIVRQLLDPLFVVLVDYSSPLLRLLSSKHKDAKISEKHLNPVMLVFIGSALAEYSQMSTHVLGFQSFFSFFAYFCNGQISHQQHKGK